MAPPAKRRSGYSRRAQYTTFFGYIAGGIGAGTGAVLLIMSLSDSSRFSGVRSAGADAVAPAAKVVSGGKAETAGFFETVGGFFTTGSQNSELRRELDIAKVKLVEAQATADENRRLKALLQLTTADPKPVAVARLIGSTPSSARRFATLGVGANQGVAVGMPVRSPVGLVGRVLEVGANTSRVLLIIDPESTVPVRRATDGIPAFAQGRADGTLQLRLLNLNINPFKVGDTFVTSGSGGLYRPGIAVAVATSLTRDGAIARVISDPTSSEFVTVEKIWAPEAVATAGSKP